MTPRSTSKTGVTRLSPNHAPGMEGRQRCPPPICMGTHNGNNSSDKKASRKSASDVACSAGQASEGKLDGHLHTLGVRRRLSGRRMGAAHVMGSTQVMGAAQALVSAGGVGTGLTGLAQGDGAGHRVVGACGQIGARDRRKPCEPRTRRGRRMSWQRRTGAT